jgi:hypothetical protein
VNVRGSTQAAGALRRRGVAAGLVAIGILASLAAVGDSPAQSGGPGLYALRAVGNFNVPQYVTRAPGAASPGFLYVVEDAGTIRIVDRGQLVDHPFLDITGLVKDGREEGLLSVAFPPDYGSSGLFYVYFTNQAGNNEVDEFQVSPSDPTDALEETRRRVIGLAHPGRTNHNGGQLQFTPDGTLWIATGDGGGSGDPDENAQDLRSPLGKLLRIDPRQTPTGAYSIPADNPFVGVAGRDTIWSYGLRNPWRFSIDRDHVLIGDVGQRSWEEIDYETLAGARGANFGWDNYEGAHLFEGPVLADHELPILEYSSDDTSGNCSVTGGYVVRDPNLPDLVGRYVYADFCAGELRSMVPTLDGALDDAPLGVSVSQPASFGVGPARRLYVASLDGAVYRLFAR